jgi:septation ring formation regulator EzrA
MKTIIYRLFGILILLGAFSGVALSTGGIAIVWREQVNINTQVTENLDLLKQTMLTTTQGLDILESTLENASTKVEQIRLTSAHLADTMAATSPALDSLGELFGVKMTAIVTDTQDSLSAAESSATLIDDTLKVISAIPLIGARYAPEASLSTSIAQISTSLDALPVSFSEIEQNLSNTSTNLQTVQGDVEELYTSLEDIQNNLADAQAVIQDYQGIALKMQEKLDHFQQTIPARLKQLAWGITFVLAWLGVASLGLFTQGLELIKQR